MMYSKKKSGFTLAELLIALAILGVIATFVIPKIVQAQQDSKKNAIAKEIISTMSGAIEAYKLQNGGSHPPSFDHLTPYINYVRRDTVLSLGRFGALNLECSAGGRTCLELHNGGYIMHFGSSWTLPCSNLNANHYSLNITGSADPNDGLIMYVYCNGRVRTRATIEADTEHGGFTYQPAGTDPSWFTW